jgi:hypothetical protein
VLAIEQEKDVVVDDVEALLLWLIVGEWVSWSMSDTTKRKESTWTTCCLLGTKQIDARASK